MNETVDQYKKRLHSYVTDEPVAIQKHTADRLEELLGRLPEEKLLKKKEGRWSIAEILSHFAEGEIAYSYRIRMIASSNGIPIQAYDQNEWIKNTGYLQKNPRLALQLFTTLRRANLEFFKALPSDQKEFYGMHSERGKESINDMLKLLAGHDINHLKQIEELMNE